MPMTSPLIHARTTDALGSRGHGTTRGFTLVEMIVVIGILLVLVGLLIPAITMVMRSGQRTMTAATLSSISSALDAYQKDFGDYPRFAVNGVDPLNEAPDRGARLLARALFGVAPMDNSSVTSDTDPRFLFNDGHGTPPDPLGFKDRRQIVTRGGVSAATFPGPVREPYLDREKFNIRRTTDASLLSEEYVYGPDAVILDGNDNPILYYPARFKQPNINAALSTATPPAPAGLVRSDPETVGPAALYNAFDNRGTDDGAVQGLSMFDPDPTADKNKNLWFLAEILGDKDQDGRINAGEQANTTGPFLLIAAGEGGFSYEPSAPAGQRWSIRSPIANFAIPEFD